MPTVTTLHTREDRPRPVHDREATLIRAVLPGVEVREADPATGDAGPTLIGHFAVFDRWTEVDSWWEGRFLERIAPGAFRKTMREQRDQIKVTFNHGHDVLGDQILGPIEELREDEIGAYYEVGLLDGIPDLLMSGLRAGAYGASFRFKVIREDLFEEPDASDYNPSALPERTIKEVRLFEFGPVTFPAYAEATAGVRAVFDRFEGDTERLRAVLLDVLEMKGRATERADAPDDVAGEPATASESREKDTAPAPGPAPTPQRDRYLTRHKETKTWQLP